MIVKCIKTKLFTFVCCLVLVLCCNKTEAQLLKYSRQNIFIGNPDDVQLVANVAGMHHLLSFNTGEYITLFIFNQHLEFKKKLATPFKIPENATVKTIVFADFYYLSIYARQEKKYSFWKVDAVGNCTDQTFAFEKLLATQLQHIEFGFGLTENKNQLCLTYHTYIPKLEKNVLTRVLADSLLRITHTTKLMYEFKENGEKLLQEEFLSEKYLLVLKSMHGGTALKLMKVDIATGLTVSNEFSSSGYHFSQPEFTYSEEDSTITVSSLLVESYKQYSKKKYVFVSRLNSMLVETVPFILLKTQFRKNTGTNFVLVNEKTGWVGLKASWGHSYNTLPDNWPALYGAGPMPPVTRSPGRNADYAEEQLQGIRFSQLDKNLRITSDSLVNNNRDSYTLKPGQFTHFGTKNRDYLVVAQQFFTKSKGLLMISANDEQRLSYTQLPVVNHYDYLLHKARVMQQQAIIIPYLYKLEAGLIKITGN